MKSFGSASAVSRRVVVGFGLAAVLCTATITHAQQAPAPAAPAQEAAAPAPAADPFKFSTPAAAVIWIVKAESAADFETIWSTIRAKLATSAKPEVKAIGDVLKLYKVDGPPSPQGFTYFMHIDPVTPTTSYSPTVLLFESELFAREEADKLFERLQAASGGINPLPMLKIQ